MMIQKRVGGGGWREWEPSGQFRARNEAEIRFDNDNEAASINNGDGADAAAADDDDVAEANTCAAAADTPEFTPRARVLATICMTMGCTARLKSLPLAPRSPCASRAHAPTASTARARVRGEQREDSSWEAVWWFVGVSIAIMLVGMTVS